MAAKTSGELEKEFIDGLAAATGKDLNGWLEEIKKSGIAKRNDILDFLKRERNFGHMHASLLAGIYFNGGKPVYGSTDELLDNQFAKCSDMRALYEKLVKFALENFAGGSVLPKKTYVSILEKREFAAVNIKPKELRVGLDLGERPFEGRVEKAKLTGPMPRISHMVVVADEAALDAELADLMRESHSRCH